MRPTPTLNSMARLGEPTQELGHAVALSPRLVEAWPKLGATDFTPHITKLLSDRPEILICGLWGGDYVAFYKQALRYGLFDKMKVATTLAFGGQPHAIGTQRGCSISRKRSKSWSATEPDLPRKSRRAGRRGHVSAPPSPA